MGPGMFLLRDHRLQKSLVGLQERLDTQFERIDAVQSESTLAKENLQAEFDASNADFRAACNQDLAKSLTASDEELNRRWTFFDQNTLGSLTEEKHGVKQIREALVKTKNAVAADLKSTTKRLRTQARSDREKLQSTYEQNKTLLRKYRNESESILAHAEEFATNRLIKFEIPNESPQNRPAQEGEFSFAAARQDIDDLLAKSHQHLKRLTDRPLAKFSESWQIWASSILLGALTAVLVWLTQTGLEQTPRILWTLSTFVGACIGFGLGSMLVIRSIIKKQVQTSIPLMATTHHQNLSLIEATEVHLKHAVANRIQMLEEKLKQDLNDAETNAEQKLVEAKAAYDRQKIEIAESQARRRGELHSSFESEMTSSQVQSEDRINAIQNKFQVRLAQVQAKFRNELEGQVQLEQSSNLHARSRIRNGIETLERRFGLVSREVDSFCPDWPTEVDGLAKGGDGLNELAYIPIGQFTVSMGADRQAALSQFNTHPLHAKLPLVFKMIEDGLLLIRCNTQNHTQAQGIIRNILMKAFYSLPAGSLQVTIIDPDGLGREYSNLMQLADTDPALVNHRVWTQNVHISEQLAKLSHHTEDVIQQLLRDRYQDIRQYNREAGTMSEPYRMVVWSRFPAGVDEASWRYFTSLISSGGRCGVSTILLVDDDMPLPPMIDLKRFENIGLHIRLESQSASNQINGIVEDPSLAKFPITFSQPADANIQKEVLRRVADESLKANRVEVPFEAIIPPESQRYQSRSASGLVIPIGQAGLGRTQTLRLGHGTAQHVLVAGKTGSGKSSFLHTLVTSAAYHYSPNELRLVLLDFKKGVEFQVYSETQLSHADIIGIESQREFGLSAFEYLDRIMQKRGEAFRNAGVQDVPGWCNANPDQPMPRILVVVDEFQEIFTEDDKLAQQATMYLDRIVRQGRSFGIHVVLASQTLGGAYSLPRTTLAQMAVRVALQCEGADAMMILSEDNLAAERLRHSGQAVYNDQSGRIEGNQPFQVSYLNKATQLEILGGLERLPRLRESMHGGLEKPVIFDGHHKAVWDIKHVDAYLKELRSELATVPLLLLGESVSIEPALAIGLHRQAAQNLLLVGQDDENIAAVLNSMTSTFIHNDGTDVITNRHITVLDTSRDEDANVQRFVGRLQSNATSLQRVAITKIDDAIVNLHAILKDRLRMLDDDSISQEKLQFTPELLIVPHLGRARTLRRNEEFSFDDDGQIKVDKLFQDILRDGPSVAIHTCIGCDNANTVNRWLTRQSLHDFEYRVLMQMSVSDSNHLIDSAGANRLDKNVLLLYTESTGLVRKFRPYSFIFDK